MKDLLELRDEIDKIDREIVSLYEQRNSNPAPQETWTGTRGARAKTSIPPRSSTRKSFINWNS